MKKFINNLYEECIGYKVIPDVYFDEYKNGDVVPRLDNFYSKAVLNKFEGTVVPLRNSELEDLALCVSNCIEAWNGGVDYYNEVRKDKNSVKFYNALCHCLIYVDYESARYNYDYHPEVSLNHFYLLCNELGIKYNRVGYAFKYDSNLTALVTSGFRKNYLNSMVNDNQLMNNSLMTYYNEVLLNEDVEIIWRKHIFQDWLSNPQVRNLWNKIPDEYIRNHYMDSDFYENLAKGGRLPLLAIFIDIIRVEMEDLGEKFIFHKIEHAMGRGRFICRKIIEAYDLKILKDTELNINEKYQKFLDKWPELSIMVQYFPTYESEIKNRIEQVTNKEM